MLVAAATQLTFQNNYALADDIRDTKDFRKDVTLSGIRAHQKALQKIANQNNGTRVAGTEGFEDSVAYVVNKLHKAGYDATVQDFDFLFVGDATPPILSRETAPAVTFGDGPDFQTMAYSGSGDATVEVDAVDLVVPSPAANTSNSGCEAADFAGFTPGHIALMQRGTCSFRVKADNAFAAGAAGAIIFNEGNPDRTGVISGTLGEPLADLPVAGTTFALGDNLRNGVLDGPTGVTVHLRVDSIAEMRTSHNIIAETRRGDPTRVVVVGAHLDSVSRGPGINDNGSGSATILEVAEQLAKANRSPRNKVRFMWYGSEEFGLLGSTYYVENLTDAERDNILLMLNFDMIGSPNFVRFIYDGDNSAFPVGDDAAEGPPGSAYIEQVFTDFFGSQRLATEETPFDGRSDYGPFIDVGIPAGGLFTGAEGEKTAEEADIFGGTAGLAYDPCYHLACDTYANNSNKALDQMSDAVAHTVLFFSRFKGDPANPVEHNHDHRGSHHGASVHINGGRSSGGVQDNKIVSQ